MIFTTEKRREMTFSILEQTSFIENTVKFSNQIESSFGSKANEDKTNREIFRTLNSELTGLAYEYKFITGYHHPMLEETETKYISAEEDGTYLTKSLWDSSILQEAASLKDPTDFFLDVYEGSGAYYPEHPIKHASWTLDSNPEVRTVITTEQNLITLARTALGWYTSGGTSGNAQSLTIKDEIYYYDNTKDNDSQEYTTVGYKEYNEVPPTAYYSMDSVPEIPDDPAGVTYLQDAWATVDGWSATLGGSVSVSDGALLWNRGSSINQYVIRSLVGTGTTYKARVRLVSGTMTDNKFLMGPGGGGVASITEIPSDGSWAIISLTSGAPVTNIVFYTTLITSDEIVIAIDWIYIGTGAYLPNSLIDNSGNGNHGTIFGATPVAGISSNALAFDGINDYVYATPSFGIVDSYSISFWAKQTATNNLAGGVRMIYSLGAYNASGMRMYGGVNLSTYSLQVMYAGGVNSLGVVLTLVTNLWAHVVVTITASTKAYTVYKDGVLVASGILANTPVIPSSALYLGCQYAANYFVGSLDEPRIYNRALSAEEVKYLYENKKGWDSKDYLDIGYTSTGNTVLINPTDINNICLAKVRDSKTTPARMLIEPYFVQGIIPNNSLVTCVHNSGNSVYIEIVKLLVNKLKEIYTNINMYLSNNPNRDKTVNSDMITNINSCLTLIINLYNGNVNSSTLTTLINSIESLRSPTWTNRSNYIVSYLTQRTDLYDDRFRIIDARLSKKTGTLKELMKIDKGLTEIAKINFERSNQIDWFKKYFTVKKSERDGDWKRRIFIVDDGTVPSFYVGETVYLLSDNVNIPEIEATIDLIVDGRLDDFTKTDMDDEGNLIKEYYPIKKIFLKNAKINEVTKIKRYIPNTYKTSEGFRIIKQNDSMILNEINSATSIQSISNYAARVSIVESGKIISTQNRT